MLIVSFNLGGKYTFIIFFFKLFTEVSHIQTAKQDQEFQTHLYWEAYQLPMASSGSSLVLTNDPFQRHQNHLLPCLSWAPSPLVLAPRSFSGSWGCFPFCVSLSGSHWLYSDSPGKDPWWRMTEACTFLKSTPLPQHPDIPALVLMLQPWVRQNMLPSASLSLCPCPSASHRGVGLCLSVTSALSPLTMALLTLAATTGCAQVGTSSHQGSWVSTPWVPLCLEAWPELFTTT